jgi:hypothetical protein
MGGRRGNGEGSIYQRSSDGRWLGVASLGYGATALGATPIPLHNERGLGGLRRTGQRRPDLALDRICAGQHSG